KRFQRRVELVQDLVGEACAYFSRVDELSGRVVADQQRPRIPPALALSVEPTADHQLLAVAILDLDPGAAPASWLVLRVQPLGHDALEASLGARLEHRLAGSLLERRRLPGGPGELEALQRQAAVRVAVFHPRMALLPEEVEDHVRDGDLFHLPPDLGVRRQSHALLDLLEAGPAFVVEGDDLAVEDDLGGAHRAAHRMDLRIAWSDVVA